MARKRVENQIATADREFRFGCGDFCEGHLAAVRGVQLGLDVGIGEEDEIEGGCWLWLWRCGEGRADVRDPVIQERNTRKRGGGSSGGQRLQKFSAKKGITASSRSSSALGR